MGTKNIQEAGLRQERKEEEVGGATAVNKEHPGSGSQTGKGGGGREGRRRRRWSQSGEQRTSRVRVSP